MKILRMKTFPIPVNLYNMRILVYLPWIGIKICSNNFTFCLKRSIYHINKKCRCSNVLHEFSKQTKLIVYYYIPHLIDKKKTVA